MALILKELGDGVLDVVLEGRLDTPGVEAIETKLTNAIVPRGGHAILDLSQVEFVGSMGIRMFMAIAHGLSRRKHMLVLYAPRPLVRAAFDTVSLNSLVPVAADRAAALALLNG
jgi:anti-sigma B factor antagonist